MRKSILAVAVAAATVVSGANAAGFYLKELSITGQGRAFAGEVTNSEDASAVYFNPAATAALKGSNFSGGLHILSAKSEIVNVSSNLVRTGPVSTQNATAGQKSGNPYDTAAIPNIYATHELANGSVIGFGFNNPFGLTSEFEKTWAGRYDSIKTELKTPSFNFSVAKNVNKKLAIGFTLEAQKGDAILEAANPLTKTTTAGTGTITLATAYGIASELNNATAGNYGDVNAQLNASSSFRFAPTLGFTYNVSERTVLGGSYRSGIKHTAKGSFTVTPNSAGDEDQDAYILSIAANAAKGLIPTSVISSAVANGSYKIENATAQLSTPDIASLGISSAISDQTTVYADATYYGWSAFENITITTNVVTQKPQKYKDTVSFGLGVEHVYNNRLTARAGVMFDPTPTDDQFRSSRTPDADRTWIALGGSYSTSKSGTIDFAFTHIMLDDGALDLDQALTSNGTALGQNQFKANTSGSVDIISIGYRHKF